jgi:VWFA-related protein
LSRILILFLLASAFPAALRAQEPSDVPVIKSSTHLVVLDVVVTDRSGQPARNLLPQDFTVLEDGVPQKITSFEAPDLHVAAPGQDKSRTVTQPVARGTGGAFSASAPAFTILVLDELNSQVADQAYGRVAIEKFLKSHGPLLQQPTALMILGQKRLELLHDYSRDARSLVDALHRRHAELPFSLMHAETSGVYERLSKTLWAMQQIAAANSHFAGRKNLLWIGPGFPVLNQMVAFDADDRHRIEAAINEETSSLVDARVVVYTIDPLGLPVTPTLYLSDGSLDSSLMGENSDELVFENIALETGGRILRLRNDVDVEISTSVEDGATYYTLAYSPMNHDWNGKFRKLQVEVSGPGLRARTRKGYYALSDTSLTDHQIDNVLTRAIINSLTYRSLGVSAAFATADPGPGQFKIEVDGRALDWKLLPNGKHRCEVTVLIAIVGVRDRVVANSVRQMEVVLDENDFEKQWDKPVTFKVPSLMPPKAKLARVVVRDASNGHVGSADLSRESLLAR